MRKPKSKSKDKFSATEVGTLVEQFRSEFKVFGEDLTTLKDDVKATKEMVGKNFERITLLEIAVRDIVNKISALTASIDRLAKTKTDREEFKALEGRVGILEAKVESLSK